MDEPIQYDLVTISLNKKVDEDDIFTPKPTSGITIPGLKTNIKALAPVFFFGFATELEIIFLN